MDSAKKKQLISAYKEKPAVGGIYSIQCGGNRRALIRATANLAGQENRFSFAISTNSCPEPAMRAEWNEYGAKSFSFTILDRLERKEAQTEREFAEDLDVLLQIWLEKYERGEV
jgi:hypothetical protein